MSDSLLSVGEAIEQWTKEAKGDIFRCSTADITVVQKDEHLFLMSRAEEGQSRIPFAPFDLGDVAKIFGAL